MNKTELSIGGLYSIDNGDGSFGIAKILALDETAVHIRLYKNKFSSRPQTIEPDTLSLGGISSGESFGIGHMPLSQEGFANWQPVFISQSPVTEEELVGYNLWKEDSGGIWQ